MLNGRLGLESTGIRYEDRSGTLWIERSRVCVVDGQVRVECGPDSEHGDSRLAVPHQTLWALLLGPGSSVTQDALRILGRHGVAVLAVGQDGVRCYSAPPLVNRDSFLARRHALLWANEESRLTIARKMYAMRFGEPSAAGSLDALRGMEGARTRAAYDILAKQHRIDWNGRAYDRARPENDDEPNMAINHCSSFMEAAATVAVAATATIPSLGFIHEDSSKAFVLDIADLYRTTLTVPIAFQAVATKRYARTPGERDAPLERLCRKMANQRFRREKIVDRMISVIVSLVGEGDERTGGG